MFSAGGGELTTEQNSVAEWATLGKREASRRAPSGDLGFPPREGARMRPEFTK